MRFVAFTTFAAAIIFTGCENDDRLPDLKDPEGHRQPEGDADHRDDHLDPERPLGLRQERRREDGDEDERGGGQDRAHGHVVHQEFVAAAVAHQNRGQENSADRAAN